uniref:Uncharacterized protein n=1 Tax=Mus spicilegus TaxID=10103 RepID=A0A8C6GDN9_MUSSI
MRKGRPRLKKRELPQQAVPSSSSWSLGSVVAAFILLSQNKEECQRRLLKTFRAPPTSIWLIIGLLPSHLKLSYE